MLSENIGFVLKEMLKGNNTLRSIQFTDSKLTDKVASCIATGLLRNYSLQVLNLSGNSITHIGTKCIFQSLEQNATLEELDLAFNPFDLQQKSLSETTKSLGCIVEKMLKVNKTLRSMRLQDCGLEDNIVTHIATGIAENDSIKILDLSCNRITTNSLLNVLKSLERNTTLQELDLQLNLKKRDSTKLDFVYDLSKLAVAIKNTLQCKHAALKIKP